MGSDAVELRVDLLDAFQSLQTAQLQTAQLRPAGTGTDTDTDTESHDTAFEDAWQQIAQQVAGFFSSLQKWGVYVFFAEDILTRFSSLPLFLVQVMKVREHVELPLIFTLRSVAQVRFFFKKQTDNCFFFTHRSETLC